MRKLFLISMLSGLIAVRLPAVAQCPSNRSQTEITASYGLITGSRQSDQFSTSWNNDRKTLTASSGATFLTVRYFLFNRLAFGGAVGTSNENGQYADRANPAFVASTFKTTFTTTAVEVYYIYYFRRLLEIYTNAGLGPTFTSTETTAYSSPGVAGTASSLREEKIKAQYTPVGVRYGGRLGGFIEIGIGYKGLINGGISYKFGSPCWWKQ